MQTAAPVNHCVRGYFESDPVYPRQAPDCWTLRRRILRMHDCPLPRQLSPHQTGYKGFAADITAASVPDHRAYFRAPPCSSTA